MKINELAFQPNLVPLFIEKECNEAIQLTRAITTIQSFASIFRMILTRVYRRRLTKQVANAVNMTLTDMAWAPRGER